MNRQEKAQIIEKLSEKASRASIAVVTGFAGLTAEHTTALRKDLRDSGVEYQVVKNTLARIALKETNHGVLCEHLKDNCAVALGYDDPVPLAKALADFAKKNKKFEVKFGSLEGRYLDDNGLKELAKLPGKPELLASVLGTMNAVPTNFVGLFANLLRNTLYALTAIKEQKENAA